MIGIINRGNLPDTTQSEFENFSARLREIFLKEHNEDGTHITQDRVLNFVPVGAIQMWPTDTAPTGWLLCRGQQVSRATYQALFNLVSTTYGVGDGSTTFNIPNLQQRFPLGKAAAGTGSVLAGTGGTIDHTHTTGAVSGSTANSGGHGHTVSGSTANESSHTHDLDVLQDGSTATSTAGGITLNYQAGGSTENLAIQGHAHFTVTPGSGTHTSNAGSAHAHSAGTLAADSVGDHSHGAGTLAVGASGSNNPPFISLNFIIFTGVA
jgi:microcystin-dependent protein